MKGSHIPEQEKDQLIALWCQLNVVLHVYFSGSETVVVWHCELNIPAECCVYWLITLYTD